MNPVLVTLYGNSRTCGPIALGGGAGPSVDLNSQELGFDFAKLFSAIGKGVSAVAQGVGKAKSKRDQQKQEQAQREAARLALIAQKKRKMLLYVALGGGVLAIGAGTFFLTRKRKK